ncbi:MAG TPA: ComEC/Rec2 family competence protein [Planctomycetota bacterium]|jgi:competence protein ComEC|nr:ComEC/Rec2 family competence protein [Planctomycetota bacterium]
MIRALRNLGSLPAARRPLLLAPALLVGILAAGAIPLRGTQATILAAGAGVFALAAALSPRSTGLLLAASFAFAGAGKAIAARPDPGGCLPEVLRRSERLYRVEGTIAASPVPTRTGEATFDLTVESVRTDAARAPARGILRVTSPSGLSGLLRGDRIEALGRLRPPRLPSNPGESTPALSLAARGVVGYLEAGPGTVRILATPPAPSLLRAVDRLRLALLGILRVRIAPRHQGIAASLLLGLREPSDAAVLDLHARTGVLHYLAVSGVHAILAAGAVLAVARAARASRRTEGAVLFVALFAYSGITGFGAPVVRACLLLGVVRGARLFRRIPDTAVALALSAGVGAWIDPPAVLGASYQLSHAAAFGLVLFARPIERRLGGGRRPGPGPLGPTRRFLDWTISRARQGAAVSLAAWLCTTPISFHHFGTVPLWSAPVTVALAPVVTLLMVAGYGAVLLPGPVGSAAGAVFDAAAGVEAAFLRLVDGLPGTPWVPLGGGVLPLGLGCALLLALLVPIRGFGLRLTLRGLLGLAVLAAWFPRAIGGSFRLAVLDVGHGTAVVCIPSDGEAILFDGGSGDRRDPGRRILLPYLRRAGVRSVAAVVLSHADADHWNALPPLFESTLPRLLVVRRTSLPHPLRRRPASRILEMATGFSCLERAGARFTVIAPEVPPGSRENDRSLSLLVEVAGRTILLCGDPQEVGLRALQRALPDLSPDLLLAPHHGLPGRGLEVFLAECRPGALLVSTGKELSPTLRALREEGMPVHSTRERGAIEVEIDRDGALRMRRFSGRRRIARRGPRPPCPGSPRPREP